MKKKDTNTNSSSHIKSVSTFHGLILCEHEQQESTSSHSSLSFPSISVGSISLMNPNPNNNDANNGTTHGNIENDHDSLIHINNNNNNHICKYPIMCIGMYTPREKHNV